MAVMLLACSSICHPVRALDKDVLDTPAARLQGAQQPAQQPLVAATMAGSRIVGVGLRGVVIYSDDGGHQWAQAFVPVQSDLVGVQFADPRRGWAVGHDGLIIATRDGGLNWIRQLDARDSVSSFIDYYASRTHTDPAAQGFLDQIKLNMQGGSSLPYLSVCFTDDQTGYAVGSFGMIAKSSDGGAHWVPWLDHIDNPQFLNLNAIKQVDGELYIAGEQGSVFHLDRAKDRFVSVSTDYKGSFFDFVGSKTSLLVFGLEGNAYRSVDHGASWTHVKTGSPTSLMGGTIMPESGRVVLVASNGTIVVSDDDGTTFSVAQTPSPTLLAGVVATSAQGIVLIGYHGATVTTLGGR